MSETEALDAHEQLQAQFERLAEKITACPPEHRAALVEQAKVLTQAMVDLLKSERASAAATRVSD